LRNIFVFVLSLTIGMYWAWELFSWLWWYFWDGEGPNPAPWLSLTMPSWLWIERTLFIFRMRVGRPWDWFRSRFLPVDVSKLWVHLDKDGRSPEEWLFISLVGIWNLESWYKDEYDWQVKRNWDEYVAAREAQETEGAQKEVRP
jgi:hypothetical protein